MRIIVGTPFALGKGHSQGLKQAGREKKDNDTGAVAGHVAVQVGHLKVNGGGKSTLLHPDCLREEVRT